MVTRNPIHINYLSYEKTSITLALKIALEFGLGLWDYDSKKAAADSGALGVSF